MNKEKWQQLAHTIAGIITLIYGFDTFEQGDSAAAYLGLAVLFMIVAGIHKWIVKQFMQADAAFFLLEAVTIIYTAWHYKIKGHQYLYYAIALAGSAYFIFCIFSLITESKHGRRHSGRRKRRRSSVS